MDVPFNYNAAKNLELLHPRGFFLTSGRDGVYNTMTIGWAASASSGASRASPPWWPTAAIRMT